MTDNTLLAPEPTAKSAPKAPSAIARFTRQPGYLELTWKDGTSSHHAFAWLRDWCACPECEDRREVASALMLDLPASPLPRSIKLDADGSLSITWDPDGHRSNYTTDFLRGHLGPVIQRPHGHSGAQIAANLPVVPYEAFQDDAERQLDALEMVRDFGFALLKGVPNNPDAVAAIARNAGYIENGWRYTAKAEEILVAPVAQDDKTAEAADAMVEATDAHYLRTLLVPHTDFSFTAWPPGLFIFHCLRPSPDGGGATLLVDGLHVAERLRDENPEAFAALSTVRQPFRGHGSVKIDWSAQGRVISVDETGNITGIRFALPSRRPVHLRPDAAETYHRALQSMLHLIMDPACQIELPLNAGDCLLMDNHRILHGRTGMDPKAGDTRWFRRFDVERDAVQTRIRLLARRLGRTADPLIAGAHG